MCKRGVKKENKINAGLFVFFTMKQVTKSFGLGKTIEVNHLPVLYAEVW